MGWYDDQRRTPTCRPADASGSDSDDDSPSAESRAAGARRVVHGSAGLGPIAERLSVRRRWVKRFVEVDDRPACSFHHSLPTASAGGRTALFLLAELRRRAAGKPGVIEPGHGADDTTVLPLRCASEEDQRGGCAASRIASRGAPPRAARRPPRGARAVR